MKWWLWSGALALALVACSSGDAESPTVLPDAAVSSDASGGSGGSGGGSGGGGGDGGSGQGGQDAGTEAGAGGNAGGAGSGGSTGGQGGSAGAPPPGAYAEVDGIVVMETENHSVLTGGWSEEAHAETSGGLFMRALAARDPDSRFEFPVQFTRTGWYKVWIRSNSTSDDDNDCYVLLDGALGSLQTDTGWVEVSGIKTNNRSWGGWDCQAKSETDIPLAIRRRGTHVEVTGAGQHVFALGSRSVDFQVDKIVLVHEGETFEPTGMGPPETRVSP